MQMFQHPSAAHLSASTIALPAFTRVAPRKPATDEAEIVKRAIPLTIVDAHECKGDN